VLTDYQIAMLFFLPPPIYRIGEMKTMHLYHILMVDESWMHSFDTQLQQQNVEWHAEETPGKKIAWRSQVALKVMLVIVLHLKWTDA
jgi:uncharacterized damage-inducible protein DinB